MRVRPWSRCLALLAALAPTLPACRRHGGSYATHAPRAPSSPARAFRATSAADLLRGPYVAGRVGDYVLENGYLRAVIDDVTGGGGFAMSGGQLLDLGPRDGEDSLGQLFNYLGEFPRQLFYRTIRAETRADGTAAVVVTGDDPRTPGLAGETAYSLGRHDHALTLRTTLTNRGAVATDVGLGDAIQWSGAEHWAPGRGFALRGMFAAPYFAGVGLRVTYAYAAPGGRVEGPSGGNWTNPMQRRMTLAPGESVTYVRRIGVAGAGDVTGAVAATGYVPQHQWLRARLVDAATGAPVAGVRVVLTDARGNPAAMGATDARGAARIAVDPGSYRVQIVGEGRKLAAADAARAAAGVTITAGRSTPITLSLDAAGTLAVHVVERDAVAHSAVEREVPARVLVYGLGDTPEPFFGPIGRADGARNAFVVPATGRLAVPLAPGRYRVVATRGFERNLAERVVEVHAGERVEASLALARVIDTRGYLCGDFHSHQAPSLDAPVTLRDRVRAAAGEGLEVLASTDHNVISDLGPAARDEGLASELLTLTGDEASTDAALRPAGHWNLYPLTYRADAPRGGAPDLLELAPDALIARARALAPGAVVQVNHPRSGVPTGMLDVVGYDRASNRATRGELHPTFDALEVWNGRNQTESEPVLLDWLAMLRAGARITATANSDSHAIVQQEVGYPRTCFAVSNDDVAWVSARDVVRALRETRDVVLTDGPFIRVETADGQSALGRTLLPDARGEVELRVRVESPAWSAADTLELVHSSGTFEVLAVNFAVAGDVVRGETTVRVPASEGFALFRARGSRPIAVLVGDPPLRPMALTNPVYFETVAAPRVGPR